MPIYQFEHPKTGEVFEVTRPMSEYNDPFSAPDGVECKNMMSNITIVDKNQEVFQMDEDYTKLTNPKFVKFKDGHKENYSPTKHRGGAGKSSDNSKWKDAEVVQLPPVGRAGQKVFKAKVWWSWNVDKKTWEQE